MPDPTRTRTRDAAASLLARAEAGARRLGCTLDRRPGGGWTVHHPTWPHPRPCKDLPDVLLTLSYVPALPPRQAGEPTDPEVTP